MEQPPVRTFAGVMVTALAVFAGTFSYTMVRERAAEARQQQAPPAVAAAKVVPPKPKSTAAPQAGAGAQASSAKAGAPRRHVVQQGDTLWEIAAHYGVSLQQLLASNPAVDNPGHVQIGQELVLPDTASAPAAAVGGSAATGQDVALGGAFIWPVIAPISSPFGPRWGRNHAGVDLAANMGDPIKAARDGTVLSAGEIQGYGQTIVLSHADGTRTLYAHCSALHVKAGDKVKQGQVIGLVGSTGQSTGPHLHFEIIVNDHARDPLLYLPKR